MTKLQFTFSLIKDEKMRELNEKHRGIKHTTDVLSFEAGQETPEGTYLLGDVVVSKGQAEKQAKELGHSVEEEVAFLAAHGVLHLLGAHHEEVKGKRKAKSAKVKLQGRGPSSLYETHRRSRKPGKEVHQYPA